MKVRYSARFKKQYKRLPPKLREQFKKRLKVFRQDPAHPLLRNHPLKGQYFGYWSINISGDVRAIYRQREDEIIFVLIGTHSKLYG